MQDSDLVLETLNKRNYYEILNLPKDCSEEEIKKAYRKVLLNIPDVTGDPPG